MTESTLSTIAFALYARALIVYFAALFARRENWAGGGFILAVIGFCYPSNTYNLFHQNTGGDYVGWMAGIGDLTGDPAYVGGIPFDFHLTALSAAIDAGNPTGCTDHLGEIH